ncbi:hypothetical protein ABTZ03_09735 [Kitasatospora sp. NPDC096077]|uniref:hypothetical protein n=1 Tax=Kitasatospora sp. NPDC096077 TaxID=3155544 RepID=UPI00331994A8
MDDRAGTSGTPKRRWRETRAARTLIVLAGLPLVALGFLLFVNAFEERGAYRTAPLCDTPTPGPDADCLLPASGKVTRKWEANSTDFGASYYLNIARGTGPAKKYEVDEPLYEHVEAGTAVDLKIWKGEVILIAHGGHEATNLVLSWPLALRMVEATLLIAAGTVVTAFGLPGRNSGFWDSSPILAMGMALAVFMGVYFFVLMQWPFPVTLGLTVTAWLATVPVVRYLHTSFS